MSTTEPSGHLRLPTARELVQTATAVLAAAGVPSPRHDALALAAHAFGLPRLELVLAPPVTQDVAARMALLVGRRRQREPLQHILGYTVFRYVTLQMAPEVFVPRPETEVVAGAAIEEVRRLIDYDAPDGDRPQPLVVDLCTGSGAIAAAVGTETRARVIAVDAAPAAVRLAARNLAEAGVGAGRAEQGDVREPALLAQLDGAVDVVVSNPPYIPPDAVPIDPEVRDHDPALALYGGGADGLELPAAVVRAAQRLLRPGGLLVMEHADLQGPGTRALAERTGAFTEITTGHDLTGRDRYLQARRETRATA